MYFALTDLSFWFSALFFLLAAFVSWFIPGWVVLSQVSWKNQGLKATLSLPVGLALWGFQGYVFGYLDLRLLSFLYLFVCTIVFFQQQRQERWKSFAHLWQVIRGTPLWIHLAIVLSAGAQVLAHVGSGLRTSQGVMFYFVNSVDGMMHIAYIQELARRFPPQEPGAAGFALQNYHYWSDLVLADIHRVWQIPIIHLFFQFAPVLLALWSMLLVTQVVRFLGGNKRAIVVALFLFGFGSDATYLLTQALHGTWGSTVASLDTGPSFFFNIPQVFARFIFLASFLLFLESWQRKSWRLIVLTCLLIASLFGFKVYYALYAICGFCSVVAFEVVKTFIQYVRKNTLLQSFRYTWSQQGPMMAAVALLAGLSLLVYLPTNSGAGGLTFSYFEWPRRLLSAENIDYADWFLRMQVYEAAGNLRNIFLFNLWAVFLTFVAIYGTRMFGLLPLFRVKDENWARTLLLFLPANLIFILLGLFTLQTSGGLNIFNFLIVPILSLNILAAFSLAQLPSKIFVPVFAVFALLTLPRSFLQLEDFVDRYSRAKTDLVITNEQLEGFEFLRTQTDETALVQGLVTSQEDLQNQLSLYIPFFSQRDSYIGGLSMLDSHNQPTEERVAMVQNAIKAYETASNSAELRSLGIEYLYIPATEADRFKQTPVFQNEAASIYMIQ